MRIKFTVDGPNGEIYIRQDDGSFATVTPQGEVRRFPASEVQKWDRGEPLPAGFTWYKPHGLRR